MDEEIPVEDLLSDSQGKKREIDAKTLLREAAVTQEINSLEVVVGVDALKAKHEDLGFGETLAQFFRTYVPICRWLPEYNRGYLKSDLIAGVTSGVFAIPQAMAYALLIGIPTRYGLYSAFVPALIYAAMGGCRQIAYGPVAILSLLLSTTLQSYSSSNYTEDDRVGIVSFLAFMKGFTLLLMGVLKFGFITNFLSQPVLSGFSSAAALVIIISQLKLLFGVSKVDQSPFPVVALYNVLAALGDFKYAPFLLALGAIIFLLFIKFKFPMIPVVKIPFPGAMVTVIFGIVLLASAQDLKNSIEIVGYIPRGLPQGRFPITSIAIQNFSSLATSFLVMALLAFLEMITVGKIYSAKNGYTVDPNGELIAAGLANIVGSFFGCFPVTGGFARTPVNAQAGAKTQMTGIVCSLVVAIVLLALTDVFAYLPKAILASIIFVAVLTLFDTDQAFYLWKVNKAEWTLMLVTFLVTLGIGPQFGIFISIGLSLSLVLFRSSRPGFAILGRVVGTDVYRSIIDYPEAVCIPGIICFQFQSPVYFMNAAYMRKSLIDAELLLSKNTPTEAIIIDAQAITYIDSVGLTSFDEIIKYFHERNIVISIANLTGRAELALRRSGLVDRIGEDNLFLRLHDAIRASLANRLIIPPPPDIDPLAVDYTNLYLEQTLSKVKDKLKETFSIPIPDRDKPKDNNPPTDDIPVTLEETQQENTGNVNPLFAGQIQSSKTSPGNKSKNSSGWMVNMGQGSSQSSTDSTSDSSSSDIKLSTEEKSESSD